MPRTHGFSIAALRPALLVFLVAPLVACASFPAAQMRLPSELVAAEAMPVSGIGGGHRGAFSVGPYRGTFARDETRLGAADDVLEQRDASADFSLAGPRPADRIDAACRMRARAIRVGVVHLDAEPMVYVCRFERDGRELPARFELRAVREGHGGMLAREERRGEIELDGLVLTMRSVHDLEGSRLQTSVPIGYLFEDRGEPVGAVALSGAPVVTRLTASDERLQRIIVTAALTLVLLRDPGDSALRGEAE